MPQGTPSDPRNSTPPPGAELFTLNTNPHAPAIIARITAELTSELRALLPCAIIEPIGATAIPGCLTKGDIDLLARVEPADFQAAAAELARRFTPHQTENWSATFASFATERDDIPVGVQLVIINSTDDADFRAFRDQLRANPERVNEYNALKRSWHGRPMAEYRDAKEQFVRRVLGAT